MATMEEVNLSEEQMSSDEENVGMDMEADLAGSQEQSSSERGAAYTPQISEAEFNKQKDVYTKKAVNDLMRSEEYKMWNQKCSSCGSSWYHEQFQASCQECGGFAMQRFCPICHGRCGSVWVRDVHMSHSTRTYHWDGQCLLPEKEKRFYMMQLFVDDSEDALVDAMEDLAKT